MGDVTMNKKVKIIILIASAIAIVATILTIVFVQNLKDPEGIREYEMDGYKYKIELRNDRGNEACFFIPSNGCEIHIPEEIIKSVAKRHFASEFKRKQLPIKILRNEVVL